MKRSFLLISIIYFALSGYSRSANNIRDTTINPVDDILLLLKPGKHLAEIIGPDDYKVTPRQSELQSKVSKAMVQNLSWFRDSLKNITDISAYYAKFGLTKEEFEEYLEIAEKTKKRGFKVIGTDTVEISKEANWITFSGTGRLKELDSLRIDLTRNVALYRGYEISYSKKIVELEDKNPVLGAWSGHEYTYSNQDSMDNSGLSAANLSFTNLSLRVGRLKKNDKVIFYLSVIEFDKDMPVLNVQVPCFLSEFE